MVNGFMKVSMVSIMVIINILVINFIMIISDIIIVITISACKLVASLSHCIHPMTQILAQMSIDSLVKPFDNNINIINVCMMHEI